VSPRPFQRCYGHVSTPVLALPLIALVVVRDLPFRFILRPLGAPQFATLGDVSGLASANSGAPKCRFSFCYPSQPRCRELSCPRARDHRDVAAERDGHGARLRCTKPGRTLAPKACVEYRGWFRVPSIIRL
jgi:hypothetical protein